MKKYEVIVIENLNQTATIHSIETCGTVDGPGIRYVVFMQGCPLRCIYCHNPDTWRKKSKSAHIKSVEEVLEDVLKYRSYFHFSGGGITLTGGEPLLQKNFTKSMFAECKKEGLHTVLDTCGDIEIDDDVKEILHLTDLVLLDIKSINADTYKKTTGGVGELERVLRFSELLKELSIPTWVRFVLVPALTDNENELHELASYIQTLSNVEAVGILPFHQLGAFKWEELSLDYKLKSTPEPTITETKRVKELFRSYGLVVR
ncbi:MAG: pyruvate formate-lyase-activating protein [Oscillospiraceae bacterium]|nr:pyruvate formate-lyase-activating protein [Oscillospiraceae bacterium]